MVFSSSVFLFVFLPIVLIVYAICPKKGQNIWLLLSSLFFYFWGGPPFLLLMIASILVNYLGGLCIDRVKITGHKKILLWFFVGINLANLGYWKYANFFVEIIETIVGNEFEINEIVLPIGISFYTFQGISYIIDVYREKVQVQKNPLYVALYISFFPQLIAGPIVRYTDVETAINHREKSIDNYERGLIRFVIGLAKKAIIANTLGEVAVQVFSIPLEENTVFSLWIGLLAFEFQLYYDFSGYSDMAIGLGQVLGFKFPENFNYPYISKSVSEFWRRWHMTLSGWFRDYVYIPLGGSRRGNVYWNLFVVFLLTGMWHGADWSYLVWGIYYGVFIVIEKWGKEHIKIKIPNIVKYIYIFIVTNIGMAIFYMNDLQLSKQLILSLFGLLPRGEIRYTYQWYMNDYIAFIFIIAIIGATPIGKLGWNKIKEKLPQRIEQMAKYGYIVFLLIICMMYIMNSTFNPFIYFQF